MLPTLLVPADAAETPLQSTTQELRKLEDSREASAAPSAKEGLKPDLPNIQTPGQEVLPFSQITASERLEQERKRKQDTQKNWLLKGVDTLAKTSSGKSAATREEGDKTALENEEETPLQADDPQYLLKMYDEQARSEDARHVQDRAQASSRANPLAPFLNDWMGNSPVRGQFFDEFTNKLAGNVGQGAGPVSNSATVGTGDEKFAGIPSRPSTSPAQQENPYLVSAAPSSQSEIARLARSSTPSGMPIPDQSASVLNQPSLPVLTPGPAEQPPQRKPQPAPWADEKKYFPQLKKF